MSFLDSLLGGIKAVLSSGSIQPFEPGLNFSGSGVTVTDDPTNGFTNVIISASSGGGGVLSKDISGSANITLSAPEAANDQISLVGTPTANISVIFPNIIQRVFFVTRATAGNAFTVYCKTLGGNGVTLLPGERAVLRTDGSNIYKVSSSVTGGSIAARDFLATGDGNTDDTLALQAALDAAYLTVLGINPGFQVGKGNAALAAVVDVCLDDGRYKITAPLEVPPYVRLRCSKNALIFSNDATINLLLLGGYYSEVEGITLQGGKSQIVFFAPTTNPAYRGNPAQAGTTILHRVNFRYPSGPAILQDTTTNTGTYRRASDAHLLIKDCDFYGACFLYGTWTWFDIDGLYLTVDTSTGGVPACPQDSLGNNLAVINTGAVLRMRDVSGVPDVTPSTTPRAWIQGTGWWDIRGFRFGGESSLVPLVTKQSLTYASNPLALDVQATAGQMPLSVRVSSSFVSSCAGANWLEVYDLFPQLIHVDGDYGSFYSALNPSANPDELVSFIGTYGIWVDSAVDLVEAANREGMSIYSDGSVFGDAMRIRQSTDRTSLVGTEVIPHIRRAFNQRSTAIAEAHSYAGEIPRNNLFFVGAEDLYTASVNTTLTHVVSGGSDTSLGYTITINQANADGGEATVFLGNPSPPVGWGTGVPAGDYTFSFYCKSSYGGSVTVGVANNAGTHLYTLGVRTMPVAPNLQRVWFTFYHDGTNTHQFYVSVKNIPNTATFVIGCLAINAGVTPSRYSRPVDSPSGPTTNTTTSTLRETYFGTAAPSTGTYKVGDEVWNTAPTATSPFKWVCTVAGTPGTFLAVYLDPSGSGTPESTVTASTGAHYRDTAGKLWVKGSGSGNTGWDETLGFDSTGAASYTGLPLFTNNASFGGAHTNVYVGYLPSLTSEGGVWIGTLSPSLTNYSLLGDASGVYLNAPSGGTVNIRAANSALVAINVTAALFSMPSIGWTSGVSAPNIIQSDLASGTGQDMFFASQKSLSSGNGGNMIVAGGDGTLSGAVRLKINGSAGGTYVEVAQLAASRRIVALNRGVAITSTEMPTNSGDAVIFIGNAAVVPSANAVGGGILYVESGALKFRGSSGTVTPIAPA